MTGNVVTLEGGYLEALYHHEDHPSQEASAPFLALDSVQVCPGGGPR